MEIQVVKGKQCQTDAISGLCEGGKTSPSYEVIECVLSRIYKLIFKPSQYLFFTHIYYRILTLQ